MPFVMLGHERVLVLVYGGIELDDGGASRLRDGAVIRLGARPLALEAEQLLEVKHGGLVALGGEAGRFGRRGIKRSRSVAGRRVAGRPTDCRGAR